MEGTSFRNRKAAHIHMYKGRENSNSVPAFVLSLRSMMGLIEFSNIHTNAMMCIIEFT